MNRGAKKFIYGLLYLAVFILIFGGMFGLFSSPEPTCSDGIQNQGEEGIDCGGPCSSCELLSLEPLRASSFTSVFPAGNDQVVVLGRVTNPNDNYLAEKFSYTFHIYDISGNLLKEVNGTDSVAPLGRRFLFASGIQIPYGQVDTVTLETGETSWEKVIADGAPVLSAESVQTEIKDSQIKVTGTIKNQSSFRAKDVRVTAILFDQYGIEVFASQTLISSIWGFEDSDFAVLFPRNPDLAESVDPSRTEVFVSSS